MHRSVCHFFVCCLAVSTHVVAGEYVDTANGFRLDSPDFGAVQTLGAQVLTIAGPPEKGFSPNCNVQIQVMGGTLDEYEELSLRQFESAGWSMIEASRLTVDGKPAVRWHYRGSMRGVDFEWLSVAVERSGQFLLLTCTALKEHYAKSAELFERTTASFRVE